MIQDYTVYIFLVHLSLAILLFFIINWIGKNSLSIGYVQMSLLVKDDEAPAYNFLIRVLSPVIYLIIISALFYKLELDGYVYNIYIVNGLYILIRLSLNLVKNRRLLINWLRQICYWVFIMISSLLVYKYLIETKENIIPDFATIANELWIIIALFTYQLFNNIRLSNDKTEKRKAKYILERYHKFEKRYGYLVRKQCDNNFLEILTYSIIIYEDFNRPSITRFIEQMSFFLTKKPHSLGIMQMTSNEYIDDYDSILLGIEKIRNDCEELKAQSELYLDSYHSYVIRHIAKKYNGGGPDYDSEIVNIFNYIEKYFYKDSSILLPTF